MQGKRGKMNVFGQLRSIVLLLLFIKVWNRLSWETSEWYLNACWMLNFCQFTKWNWSQNILLTPPKLNANNPIIKRNKEEMESRKNFDENFSNDELLKTGRLDPGLIGNFKVVKFWIAVPNMFHILIKYIELNENVKHIQKTFFALIKIHGTLVSSLQDAKSSTFK